MARAAAAAVALLLPLMVAAGAEAATGYSFTPGFTVPSTANQQGLAYADGLHYVAFDMGGGQGQIIAYDDHGTEVKRSPSLPLGHAAEVSYRAADGNLYVAVYGVAGTGLNVAVVDMRPDLPQIVRTYDLSYLGVLGMVAVDNSRDQMLVKSGPKGGPHTFTSLDMDGRVVAQFTDVSQGLGQGLEVVGDDILLYTSAPNHTSNTITVYDRSGTVLSRIPVPVAVEGEGLSVDLATGRVHLGFSDHSVLAMSPVYEPIAPPAPTTAPTTRTVVLTAVADTVARQQAPTTAAGSATTLLADTEETTGAATRATPYLRFAVPALAADEHVVDARLSLLVLNATTNGPTLWRTDASWDERTMTWNSGQPARTGTTPAGHFGAMPTGRASAAVSGISPAGTVSLQLHADGPDGVQLASRNSAAGWPQLVLTVGPDGGSDTTPPPAPTLTPDSGGYNTAQSVSMTTDEPGTTLRYTVGEGTAVPADPTTDTGSAYVGPVTVSRSQVLKAAAFDAAGNRSPVTSRTYTISTTRTLTLRPIADTMARQAAPTSGAGAAQTLLADTQQTTGLATRATSYLRFAVPTLAAGEQIESARLGLQVTNGTGDGPAVWRTGTSWGESTLTWKSGQPGRIGSAPAGDFGSMAAGWRTTTLSGVISTGHVSFQLYAESGDGVDFSSRENATGSKRPALILTVRGS
jgi:hypothetical protein